MARYLFSTWARYLSWLFIRLGLSANFITALGAVVMLVGAILLALPQPAAWLVGAILTLMFYALDVCDGQMARYYRHIGKGSSGMHGRFLASLSHGIEPLMAACLGYRIWVGANLGPWPLILGCISMMAACVAPYLHYHDTLIAWVRGQASKDENFRLDPKIISDNTELFLSSYNKPGLTLGRFMLAAKQIVLIPGYFFTLVLAVILDITVGPAARFGESVIYWRFLWLGVYTAGKVMYVLYWNAVYIRKLRSLPA